MRHVKTLDRGLVPHLGMGTARLSLLLWHYLSRRTYSQLRVSDYIAALTPCKQKHYLHFGP